MKLTDQQKQILKITKRITAVLILLYFLGVGVITNVFWVVGSFY